MNSTETDPDDPKRAAVLAAALGVFGRYGFQKTSMAEVAQAAGISRPGLYLLFPNKEELYRATMGGVMERAQRAMEACFDDETLGFEERVVSALDALMGQYVDTQVARDLGELLENSGPQLGTLFHDYQERARTTIGTRIAALAPPGVLTPELSADDVMDLLFSAALTWKQTATTRAEFRDRTARAVRMICRAAN
ncbi:TetR/AcrR family transcriptional regulator [Streptomyces liangshanensis]|uniref:TetR/AcrR family transcriptional regulator n=1 Tax=Streptomyces liangshanensis TaxID=2717324 RepID=A0A6G9GXA4_9ACTN|nr:TetR/AcrR family transcriptional regulator [Streptomyces liangshanensis]QIQ02844.1 TetR/AcrR family transcriptional regulator [Streptomyces liangshanensis]